MSGFGVTPLGFARARLADIRTEIVTDLRANLRRGGLPDDIETRPDSILGILIDTFAEREATLWELAEGIYRAMYPGSAEGTSLDNAVSFTGVQRREAERSRCYALCYGTEGVVVPAGAAVRHQVSQSQWLLAGEVTISRAACSDVTLTPVPRPTTEYTVVIDGLALTYMSDATASLPEVIAGIVAAVSTTGLSVSSDGAAVRILSDGRREFSVDVAGPITLGHVGSPGLFQTDRPVAEGAAVGDLSTIVTSVQGWSSVNNLQAAIAGRLVESDAELRARYPSGLFRLGASTHPSLEPNIRDRVAGVSAIKVFENDTDDTDAAGRPPHSVHFVVEGGLDQEIADAIYRTKAGGIQAHGAVEVEVLGDDGALHLVRFDRSGPVYVWVKVTITELPATEAVFPVDGAQRVASSINTAGAQQGIGADVVWQRYFGAIYQTPGIGHADLQFAWSNDAAYQPGAGDFRSENIVIQDFEVARFDLSRIEVT
jgi:uncharacterized phage protein gp47/JayE